MDCVEIIRDERTEESAMKLKKQQKEEEKLFKNFYRVMGKEDKGVYR